MCFLQCTPGERLLHNVTVRVSSAASSALSDGYNNGGLALLRLPTELRNQIWELVVLSKKPVVLLRRRPLHLGKPGRLFPEPSEIAADVPTDSKGNSGRAVLIKCLAARVSLLTSSVLRDQSRSGR